MCVYKLNIFTNQKYIKPLYIDDDINIIIETVVDVILDDFDYYDHYRFIEDDKIIKILKDREILTNYIKDNHTYLIFRQLDTHSYITINESDKEGMKYTDQQLGYYISEHLE